MDGIQGVPRRLGALPGGLSLPSTGNAGPPELLSRPDRVELSAEARAQRSGAPVDVTDEAALALLRTGGSEDRALAREAEQARSSYRSLLESGARVLVGRSAGNGGAPFVAVVPQTLVARPEQPFEAVVHYGGMYGTAARPDPGGGLPARIKARAEGPPPAVVVLCEARNHEGMPGGHGGYSPDWSSASDPGLVAQDALDGLGLTGDRRLVVSAHSAGGRAIAALVAKGRLACDRLELQDCLYGNGRGLSSGRAVLAWAGTPEGRACREIIYMHAARGQNGEQHLLPDGIRLAGGQVVRRIEMTRHYDAAFHVEARASR